MKKNETLTIKLVVLVLIGLFVVGLYIDFYPEKVYTKVTHPAKFISKLTPEEREEIDLAKIAKRSPMPITRTVPGLLPGIENFLNTHNSFGTPLSVSNATDWYKGKRQWVRCTNGRNLLFYMLNEEVIQVCEEHPLNRIWEKD